ncbi:MAG: DUF294 nucleotidyltransferase-like domain-containing protein, partial [Thermodesulfobacteriota bacterium]
MGVKTNATNNLVAGQSPAESLAKRRQALFASMPDWEPAEFIQAHAELIDDYFRESFASSQVGPRMGLNTHPYAVVALGGYGRSEQCIHSDVDVLFLFEGAVPEEADRLVQEYVYPLWDIGMDVGYAARSLRECLRMAKNDYEILTPLL